MTQGARLRVPLDTEYAHAIGAAAYGFAGLEWNAVWCCEKLETDYLKNLKRKMAGTVALDLLRLALATSSSERAQSWSVELLSAAQEFKRLVGQRNTLLHAKPGTEPGGAQRLFREGQAWSVANIEAIADEFAECSIRLNAVLHAHLMALRSDPA